MKVNCSGLSSQSRATLATTGDGGARPLSMTSVPTAALSWYPRSSNSASFRASALAGPEPSAKKASLPSPCERLQPAYWLARQAMTGWDERTMRVQGQRGVDALDTSAPVPSPPMQISASCIPAAMLPGWPLPASISVSPSSPRLIPIFNSAEAALNRSTSAAARTFTLMGDAVLMKLSHSDLREQSQFFVPRALSLPPLWTQRRERYTEVLRP